ncbi:MAG: glycerophosphodiester phosphodiesterase [Clostridiales bacterium]|nr:glycerophosphodiester phosphodiesterase [Clostridiales bacterium]
MSTLARTLIASAAGLTAAAATAGLFTFLVAPGKSSEALRRPFYGQNLAHRGLHTEDKSVPENSLPAFVDAACKGYGSELDVRMTADGQVVVFHDETLDRVCGVSAKVEDLTWEELKKLRLCGTNYGIPLFSQVLEMVGGRAPLLVELKSCRQKKELCRKVYEMLKAYDGEYCIESFDPSLVRWFKVNAPEVLRGQLASAPETLGKGKKYWPALLLGNLLTNFLTRPHFIAYGIGRVPNLVKLCHRMGAMRFAYTSLDPSAEETNDAVIFQFYAPQPRYK